MNAKGGSGKTTIATNLASFYAAYGYKTTLYDYDPQGSSSSWLARRPENMPSIHGISAHSPTNSSMTRTWQMRLPLDTQRVILDTPAGIKGHEAVPYLKDVDTILVPVLASVNDVEASVHFVHSLQKMVRSNGLRARIMVVANRVRPRSPAIAVMDNLFGELDVPVLARLRDSVSYLQCTDLGLGISDMPNERARTERQSLIKVITKIDDEFKDDAMPHVGTKLDSSASANNSMREVALSVPHSVSGSYSVVWK